VHEIDLLDQQRGRNADGHDIGEGVKDAAGRAGRMQQLCQTTVRGVEKARIEAEIGGMQVGSLHGSGNREIPKQQAQRRDGIGNRGAGWATVQHDGDPPVLLCP
jgi:hypothetical protein